MTTADSTDSVKLRRDVQLALIDGDERSIGPLLGSVYAGSNSDLIAAVAPLYLGGSVLDVTYGRGMWWRRFRPEPFGFHDLELDGVDFRALPYGNASWETVCFDPPYVPRQGAADATHERDRTFRRAYGLVESRTGAETTALILAGLNESARVARRWLLVKCNDFTNGGRFQLGHYVVLREAERIGIRIHDLIVHHTGPGPGGSRISIPLRARRAHSYLLVFDTRPLHRGAPAADSQPSVKFRRSSTSLDRE